MARPLPNFSEILPVHSSEDEELIFLMSDSGSIPTTSFTPVIDDRMFPDVWSPGINYDHPHARGLAIAMPMWERGGNILYDLSGNKNNAAITSGGGSSVLSFIPNTNEFGYYESLTPSINSTLAYTAVGSSHSPTYVTDGYLRFSNITISPGESIFYANVSFVAGSDISSIQFNIAAFDEDNSSLITSVADYLSRPITDLVEFSGSMIGGHVYQTSDISSVIQAIVDRGGWASGNHLQLVFKGDPSSVDNLLRVNSPIYLTIGMVRPATSNWSLIETSNNGAPLGWKYLNSDHALIPFSKTYFYTYATDGYTISIWFRWEITTTGSAELLLSSDVPYGWAMYITDNGSVGSGPRTLTFIVFSPTDELSLTFTSTGDVTDHNWFHVAVVLELVPPSFLNGKLYVNGVLVSFVNNGSLPVILDTDLLIGNGYDTAFHDLRIYKRPLIAGEIFTLWRFPDELYQQPSSLIKYLGIIIPGSGSVSLSLSPVLEDRMFSGAWFPGINNFDTQALGIALAMPLNEGAGSLINDVSGNNNNGIAYIIVDGVLFSFAFWSYQNTTFSDDGTFGSRYLTMSTMPTYIAVKKNNFLSEVADEVHRLSLIPTEFSFGYDVEDNGYCTYRLNLSDNTKDSFALNNTGDLILGQQYIADDPLHHYINTAYFRYLDVAIPQGATIVSSYIDMTASTSMNGCTSAGITSNFASTIFFDSDDGYWESSIFSDTGTIYLGYSDVGFFRFRNTLVPQGATIISATIQYSVYEPRPYNLRFSISGDLEDNADTISSSSDGNVRPRTLATSIVYNFFTAGQPLDVTSVVQEIVNQSGWLSGNALQLFIVQTTDPSTYPPAAYSQINTAAVYPTRARIVIDYSTSTTETGLSEDIPVLVKGELAFDAAAITSGSDGYSRVLTVSSVDTISNNWCANNLNIFDVTPIVQEIVNQLGWASGNAIQLFVSSNGLYPDYLMKAHINSSILYISYAVAGSSFRVVYNFGNGSVTTDTIAPDASAITLQSALEDLDGVGIGNVTVIGSAPWDITWKGIFGGQRVLPGIVIASGGQTINTIDEGYYDYSDSSINADTTVVGFSLSSDDLLDSYFRFDGVSLDQGGTVPYTVIAFRATTGAPLIAFNIVVVDEDDSSAIISGSDYTDRLVTDPILCSIANVVQGEIYTTPDISSIITTITDRVGWVSGNHLQVFLQGIEESYMMFFDTIQLEIGGTSISGGSITVSTLQAGSSSGNEIQQIVITGDAGEYALKLGSQGTFPALSWDSSATELRSAILDDLNANINDCTVTGSGTVIDPFIVNIIDPANQNIGQISGINLGLSGEQLGGSISEIVIGASGGFRQAFSISIWFRNDDNSGGVIASSYKPEIDSSSVVNGWKLYLDATSLATISILFRISFNNASIVFTASTPNIASLYNAIVWHHVVVVNQVISGFWWVYIYLNGVLLSTNNTGVDSTYIVDSGEDITLGNQRYADGTVRIISSGDMTTTEFTFTLLESSGTWVVPVGCTLLNSVECIGAGGGGEKNEGTGGGGGGNAYSTNLSVTPGASMLYSVGLGGKGGGNYSASTPGYPDAQSGGESSFVGIGVNVSASGGSGGGGGGGGINGGILHIGGAGALGTAGSPFAGGGGGNPGGKNANGADGSGTSPNGGIGPGSVGQNGSGGQGGGGGGASAVGGNGGSGVINVTYTVVTENSSVNQFVGPLKDFRFYNRVLTPGDIFDIDRFPDRLYYQPSVLPFSASPTLAVFNGIPPMSPCLEDRMFSEQWSPGINYFSSQANGLVLAFPMWEKAGNIIFDVCGKNIGTVHGNGSFIIKNNYGGVLGNVYKNVDNTSYIKIPGGAKVNWDIVQSDNQTNP